MPAGESSGGSGVCRQQELFPEYSPLSLREVLGDSGVADPGAVLRRPEQFVIFPQQKSYSCGSACLRMALQYYWIPVEEDMVREIGARAEKDLRSLERGQVYKTEDQGIGSTGIIAVLRHYRLRGYILKGDNASLSTIAWLLAADIPVIVNWQCEHDGTFHPLQYQPVFFGGIGPVPQGKRPGIYGHYSVAVGFSPDRSHLFLADPSGNVFSVRSSWFESKWWDPSPTHRRWMVAVYRSRTMNRQLRTLFKGLFV